MINRVVVGGFAVAAMVALAIRPQAQTPSPCGIPGANAIVCENMKAGAPWTEWDISGAGDPTIQGFATEISVNRGQTIQFKVNTPASAYNLDVYRLGYYGGFGARKVAAVVPSASLPQQQPACLTDNSTALLDCGNWGVSASWTVPSDATSGVYIAKAQRTDTGGASHIVFIVRDDSGHSDLLFQASDSTWQAYNEYGGSSLYVGGGANGRAYKVSYNRPFTTRTALSGKGALSWVFGSEFPMIKWLESNGFDVSYSTDTDTERRGAEILEHKAFLSVGHDEYWSSGQRASVEAARVAGVNLAFFSGNEIFWKTRWEPSISVGAVSYRTLVSYKETHANGKIDPSPVWTGTWRDPRVAGPPEGGRPENELSGQIFNVNCCPDATMFVPAAAGKLRFWRDTDVATLAPGAFASFAGMLGHEVDTDADNGARPSGLVRLSDTTFDVDSLLQDYGSNYAPGVSNHALTLYRHQSGALVFGAGTIQWPWLLDEDHDHAGNAVPDVRIQQATVNLLADMGAQPFALQPSLVRATASNDTAAPSTVISNPTASSSPTVGTVLNVTGTASDTQGRVGGVEVSTDNGVTWHPAQGRESWSYAWTLSTVGAASIRARAVDDSGNLDSQGTSVSFSIAPPVCPCSLWTPQTLPAIIDSGEATAYELGVKFEPQINGVVTGVRFYQSAANAGPHVGNLWAPDGTLLASVNFPNDPGQGWREATFANAYPVAAGMTYVISYHAPAGHYSVSSGFFAQTGISRYPLRAPGSSESPNGVFKPGASGFPNQSFNGANYWVDAVFTTDGVLDVTPPTVSVVNPTDQSAGVSIAISPSATFNEILAASTVNSNTVQLRQGGPSGPVVPATVVFDNLTRRIVIDPPSKLDYSTTFVATILGGPSGVADFAGNRLASDVTWSFTTQGAPICPCSLWDSDTLPAQIDGGDPNAYELGVRFQSASAGYILGLRYYKSAGNGGTHIGSLWTIDGTLLGRATFTGENREGWQEVLLSSPVLVQPGVTYVASYYAPQGHYSTTPNYFATTNVDNPPLRTSGVPTQTSSVFRAGSNGFPSDTFFGANYWVDVVFVSVSGDVTPPGLLAGLPAANSTAVSANTNVSARFNEPLAAQSVTPTSLQLRTASGTLLPGAMSYIPGSRTAVLNPNATLAFKSSYTVTLRGGAGGVTDLAGNVFPTDQVWSFTTGDAPGCPCSLWPTSVVPVTADSGDVNPFELGVKFQPEFDGFVTAIRFYKSAANVGSHTVSLWTDAGALLASAPSDSETSAGWQSVDLAQAVPVVGGQTYVASYFVPQGHYAGDGGYFNAALEASPLRAPGASEASNGVFRAGSSGFPTDTYGSANYWVDVVYSTSLIPDTLPPTITATQPADGSQGTSGSVVTAAFSERIDPASISSSNFVLRGQAGDLIPAIVTYSATTRTAVLTTTASMAFSSSYTATVKGGAAGPRDLAGNSLQTDKVWTFTTAGPPPCPCTLWAPTVLPAIVDEQDQSAYELGVKFQPEFDGFVNAVRFYKSAANLGPHTVSLWSDAGVLLASATATSETAVGWQQVELPQPVAVIARRTYVASYFVPAGHYSTDPGYFLTRSVEASPLRAPAAGETANGVFRAGSSGFPTGSSNGGNYWVDVSYVTSQTTSPTLPQLSISDAIVTEGDSGVANALFTVALSVPSTQTVTVHYATANGSALAGADYVATAGTLSFAPGVTSQAVVVPVIGDVLDEANETFGVNLSAPTNATVARAAGTGTVIDNDVGPSLSVNSVSVTEGNSGTVNATFTVSLSALSGQTITVNYATANGTATAPSDFTATSGTLTLAAGVLSQTISVPVVGDAVFESTETYTVNLSAATNAAIATAQGTGTILDNDMPSLTINNAVVTEINTGTVSAVFTVTLSAASSQTVAVNYATANGTAVAPADYAAASGTLSFPAGTTTRTISVAVAGDSLDEGNETFVVNLSGAANATIATAQGTGTITDNDAAPTLAINSISVTEGNTGTLNAAFTVTLSPVSGQTVTVNYATANGTATAPADYTAASGTLTFAAGTTTQTINIAVVGDALDEPNHTFVVNLSGAANATITTAQGTGTIVDNDATPTLAINSISVTEGNTGTVNAVFTVTLNAASGQTVTVNYTTANGTATAPADYTTKSGTLTFAAGTTTQTISIAVVGDVVSEPSQTFVVNLSGATNATIATSQGTGTIVDNDTPSLVVNNVSVTEGNTGTTNAIFTVTLSFASAQTVTVNYATSNGTATAGSTADYTAASGSLSFTPGTTTRQVTVAVRGDTLDEANETFNVTLSGAANATIADAVGVGTIVDNDTAPTISINNVSVTEGAILTKTFTFTLTLSAASGQTVTMSYATANGTAVSTSDYTAETGTVTFTPGTTSQSITISVRGDFTQESNETFLVNLTNAVNATFADAQGIGTILNDD